MNELHRLLFIVSFIHYSIIPPFLAIMLSNPWRNLWHVFFIYTLFSFFQVLMNVVLKTSTDGCGFLQTICSMYAKMLHSRKFKLDNLEGNKSLPQKLEMFSLRYSCIFFACDKVSQLVAKHNLHHKVLFIHGSSCFDTGITIYPFTGAPG